MALKVNQAFTTFILLPFSAAVTFSSVTCIILLLASKLIHALCGVMIQLGKPINGLPARGGSVLKTSKAAPANMPFCNATTRSFSVINCPREVLIK